MKKINHTSKTFKRGFRIRIYVSLSADSEIGSKARLIKNYALKVNFVHKTIQFKGNIELIFKLIFVIFGLFKPNLSTRIHICLENNQNPRRKTEPVTAGADSTAFVSFLDQIPVYKLQPDKYRCIRAPSVTGWVFMRGFTLVLGQCIHPVEILKNLNISAKSKPYSKLHVC